MHMLQRVRNTFIPHKDNDYHPHFLRERGIAFILIMIMSIGLFVSAAHLIVSRTNLLAQVQSALLVNLTNDSRADNDLAALRTNPLLVAAAQAKADHMAQNSYFAHTSPTGEQPWDFISAAGYEFSYAGENLGINFLDSAKLHDAWMNSPSHKYNILHDKFTEIGIATAQGEINGRPATFIVQMFGSPRIIRTYTASNQTPTVVRLVNDSQTWVAGQYLANLNGADATLDAGDEVFVTAQALNVRSYPFGPIVDTARRYSIGTVVSGPQISRGLVWWNIDFSDGESVVLGQTVENDDITITSSNSAVATTVAEGVEDSPAPIENIAEQGRCDLCERVVGNPGSIAEWLLIILGSIITLALAITMIVNIRRHNTTKGLVFGVLMLALIAGILYYLTSLNVPVVL